MNLFNNSFDSLIILYTYLLTYNLSLIILFWTFHQFIILNFKTIYSFNDLKLDFFFTTVLTLILFSIAGVPPFIGFYSKLLILLLLMNSNFFFFYIFFLVYYFSDFIFIFKIFVFYILLPKVKSIIPISNLCVKHLYIICTLLY